MWEGGTPPASCPWHPPPLPYHGLEASERWHAAFLKPHCLLLAYLSCAILLAGLKLCYHAAMASREKAGIQWHASPCHHGLIIKATLGKGQHLMGILSCPTATHACAHCWGENRAASAQRRLTRDGSQATTRGGGKSATYLLTWRRWGAPLRHGAQRVISWRPLAAAAIRAANALLLLPHAFRLLQRCALAAFALSNLLPAHKWRASYGRANLRSGGWRICHLCNGVSIRLNQFFQFHLPVPTIVEGTAAIILTHRAGLYARGTRAALGMA